MPQYSFGLGGLFFKQTVVANPTPAQVATLRDVSISIDSELKELRGQYRALVDAANGPLKIAIKAKNAQIHSSILDTYLTGDTVATGTTVIGINGESGTIAAAAYTAVNGATFKEDLGILNVTQGKYMTRVAAAPATGQYTVNEATGVYAFNAADNTNVILVSYTYTSSAAGSKKVTQTNQLMAQAKQFTLNVFNTYGGKNIGFKFFAVYCSKLSLAMKAEDYTEQDLDLIGGADSSGNVFEAYSAE